MGQTTIKHYWVMEILEKLKDHFNNIDGGEDIAVGLCDMPISELFLLNEAMCADIP